MLEEASEYSQIRSNGSEPKILCMLPFCDGVNFHWLRLGGVGRDLRNSVGLGKDG